MHLSDETISFIEKNINSDTGKLLLSSKKYPHIDVAFAVDQILARRQIKDKLPHWYANPQIILPSKIAAEQCSSEQTAFYKQRLLKGESLCDLTGGLGVDSYYFSLKTKQSYYVERFPEYCEAAFHNFKALGADNIKVLNGDSRDLLDEIGDVDCFYIDPARRGDKNKRIFAIEDCEPNVIELKEKLLARAKRLIVKVSPMADITNTLHSLPEISEIHVLSVKNDCKELLLVLDRDSVAGDTLITCVNFTTSGEEETYSYSFRHEPEAHTSYTDTPLQYVYEPNSSILKAGAFKSLCESFDVKKLHPSSHLYTSEQLINDFPGRRFRIEETIEFSSKLIRKLSQDIPKANITTRNFPVTVEELRKKSGIRDGGELYLFATTMSDGQKVLLKCVKA